MYNKFHIKTKSTNLIIFLVLLLPLQVQAVAWPTGENVKNFLGDSRVQFTCSIALAVLPLLVNKYGLFQNQKEMEHTYQLWQQEEATNKQMIKANKKNLEKKDIENAQERLVIIYRSKQLIDDYQSYIIKIPVNTSSEKKEAEDIYSKLVVQYGKSLEAVLKKNKEAINKIESDYQEAINSAHAV